MKTKTVLKIAASILLAASISSCGGGGSNDKSSSAVEIAATPCAFDVKPFLNGTQASQANSVWHCSGAGVGDFDFMAFEDGKGYSSGVGDFQWKSATCGSITIEGSVPQTISQIKVDTATGIGSFLGTQANGSVPTTCSRAVSKPEPRFGQAAFYDSLKQRMIVFGGAVSVKTYKNSSNTPRLLADTWEYTGASWKQIYTATAPTITRDSKVIYDKKRNVAVLTTTPNGGANIETWEFNGTAWAQIKTAHSPVGRVAHLMAYDSARGIAVLYGGEGLIGSPYFNDTWEYDGIDWVQKGFCSESCWQTTPSTISSMTAMAYYPDNQYTLLVGERGNDTREAWSWNGTIWGRVSADGLTVPPSFPAMTYDSNRHKMVLLTPAIWEFDNISWQNRSSQGALGLKLGSSIVYDEARSAVLIFGSGVSDTYSNDLLKWDGVSLSK